MLKNLESGRPTRSKTFYLYSRRDSKIGLVLNVRQHFAARDLKQKLRVLGGLI